MPRRVRDGFNGTLYVGATSDLAGRVMQHRIGAFEGFTRRCAVKRRVRSDVGGDMGGAIARGKTLRKWPRDGKRKLIERGNPEWNDLGPSIGLPLLEDRR